MITLEQLFDHYIINARIRPALFAVFPLICLILAWIPESKGLGATVLALLATFGFFAFLSSAISNKGNQLQKKLYKKWGGEPTTSLLRHQDDTIDQITKKRIHTWLQEKVNELKMPSPKEEEENPENADEIYQSATHYLREKTRDKQKYKMVYIDLVGYGFSRNLLALKPMGIIISFICIVLNVALLIYQHKELGELINKIIGLNLLTLINLSALAVSLTFLYIFGFLITSTYVKLRAERYAKSLLATCDREGNK
jgi:hypothetical protein